MIVLSDKTRHRIGQPFTPSIAVIAGALAHINRFTGHIGQYSVAQHSVMAAHMAPDGLKLDALLHDASEAYLGDVSAPLKAYLPEYQRLEQFYHDVIDAHFGVVTRHATVKAVDLSLLVLEAKHFGVWTDDYPPMPRRTPGMRSLSTSFAFEPWSPVRARSEFLQSFNRLTKTPKEVAHHEQL